MGNCLKTFTFHLTLITKAMTKRLTSSKQSLKPKPFLVQTLLLSTAIFSRSKPHCYRIKVHREPVGTWLWSLFCSLQVTCKKTKALCSPFTFKAVWSTALNMQLCSVLLSTVRSKLLTWQHLALVSFYTVFSIWRHFSACRLRGDAFISVSNDRLWYEHAT